MKSFFEFDLGVHDLKVKTPLMSEVILVFGFCTHIIELNVTKLTLVHVQSMVIHYVTQMSRSF